MANDPKKIGVALARALASRKVSTTAIGKAADTLAKVSPEIRRLDICAFGFCGDWWFTPDELQRNMQDLIMIEGAELGEIRLFKYGIFDPDLFHVQADLHIDGLEGEAGFRG